MKDITYFENLDAMRFIAFLFVFFSHLGTPFFLDSNHDLAFLNFIFQHGRTAVSFFFVLSGFLITYLLVKEKYEKTKINLKTFYIKRIFRILPLYFFVCLIGFLVVPILTGKFPNESIIKHIFLFANFDQIFLTLNQIDNSMILAPLWSIAIEEQFYLFWPILLIIVNPKYYLHLFILILLGSYIFLYINRFSYEIILLHTISVLPEFMLGASIAYLTFHYSYLIKLVELFPKWLIISFYLISIASFAYLPPPYSYFAYPLIFTFVILEQVFSKNSLFKVSRIPQLDYLGKISYGAYMYHSIVLYSLNIFFEKYDFFSLNPFLSKTLFFLLSLTFTVVLSHLSFNTIEKYFLNLRKNVLKKS